MPFICAGRSDWPRPTKGKNAILSVLTSTDKMASVLRAPLGFCKNAILSVLRCHFICAAMPFYLCCDTILIGLADAIHPFWSQCPRFHVEAKSSMPFYLCCDAILSVLAFGSDFGLRRWKAKMQFYLCWH